MRVGAVEAGLRPAQHFDALDVVDRQIGEVESAVADGIHLDAVDDDHQVIVLGAADAHFGDGSAAARLRHRDAGHHAQRVGDSLHAFRAQLLALEDGHGRADLLRLERDVIGGHDDVGQRYLRLCGAALRSKDEAKRVAKSVCRANRLPGRPREGGDPVLSRSDCRDFTRIGRIHRMSSASGDPVLTARIAHQRLLDARMRGHDNRVIGIS